MALPLAPLAKGRLTARLAEGAADRAACLSLRAQAFRTARGLDPAAEGDAFDALSDHLLVEGEGALLATCRLRLLQRADLPHSYTGQSYDLSALSPLPALELGRFCLAPAAATDPDPLRLTFAALARLVDATGAGVLFGCSSFEGVTMAPYRAALAPWAGRMTQLAPPIAPETEALAPLAEAPPGQPLPPLLRHYLALGGQISDRAVVDRRLNTCHVLTILPIAAIPAPHARALRRLAADAAA